MKLLTIPLYLLISFFIPWENFSIHLGLLTNNFFDLIFIIISIKLFKIRLNFKPTIERNDLSALISTILLAIGSLFLMKQLGLSNPFNYVTWLFFNLVIIGPIIEEFIFRGVFNNLLDFKNTNVKHIVSGAIFSFSHSLSIFHAPESWYRFFYLQILYTFILGVICSISFEKSKNISKPLILHIVFNFIFYLATVFKAV